MVGLETDPGYIREWIRTGVQLAEEIFVLGDLVIGEFLRLIANTANQRATRTLRTEAKIQDWVVNADTLAT